LAALVKSRDAEHDLFSVYGCYLAFGPYFHSYRRCRAVRYVQQRSDGALALVKFGAMDSCAGFSISATINGVESLQRTRSGRQAGCFQKRRFTNVP
jgi:hypothetical protein